jgi:hypothetical protein
MFSALAVFWDGLADGGDSGSSGYSLTAMEDLGIRNSCSKNRAGMGFDTPQANVRP